MPETVCQSRLSYLEILPVGLAKKNGIEGSRDPAKTVSLVCQPPSKAKGPTAGPNIDHILPAGEFSLDEDAYGRIVRINMDRIQRWDRVLGIKKHWALTGPENQAACYHGVSSTLKDVDGDGTLDLFRLINSQPYGQLARLDESGRVLWKTEKLAPGCGDESGVPVEDLDGDGRYECVLSHWATVYCIDADTGAVLWKRAWGVGLHRFDTAAISIEGNGSLRPDHQTRLASSAGDVAGMCLGQPAIQPLDSSDL